MKKALLLSALLCSFAAAQTSPTIIPVGTAPTLTAPTPITVTNMTAPAPLTITKLPENPKLDKVLTINLPSGASLPIVLGAIARASNVTLLQRDVPAVPVTLSVKGISARTALERLLNLYGDRVAGQLVGDTLVVAPPEIIARFGQPTTQQEVVEQTTPETDARQIAALTGAQVVPLRQTTILSGTSEQVAQARRLLTASTPQPQVSAPNTAAAVVTTNESLGKVEAAVAERILQALHEGVQATSAYGRVYLQARRGEDLKAAVQTLTQLRTDAASAPASATGTTEPVQRRVFTTILSQELFTRLVSAVGGLEQVALDSGTYQVKGQASALEELKLALRDAEAREGMRISVTYAGAGEEEIAGLKAMLPNIMARRVTTGIEVRGTPQEQVRASSYLKSLTRPAEEESVTVRVPLAYASPATVASQLSALYGVPSAPTAAPAAASTAADTAASTTAQPQTQPQATPQAQAATAGQGQNITLSGGVRMVTDERTRALILTGPTSHVARVQRTISDLDLRLNDIRMALKIEQISGSDGQDLGLNWNVGAGGISVGQKDGNLSAGFKPGLSPLSFEVNLQAARTQGRVNTLLDTTFVTQDGRANVFRNGGQLLLPSTNTVTNNGTTTTNTTRETYNYGLDVTLTPKLAPDGQVELEVQLQLGQAPRTGVQNSVVIEQQTLNTRVTARPGEPVILGSVLQHSDTNKKSGVPVLSEIPVIGALFGTRKQGQDTSLLLITMTAANRDDGRAPATPKTGAGVTRITLPGN